MSCDMNPCGRYIEMRDRCELRGNQLSASRSMVEALQRDNDNLRQRMRDAHGVLCSGKSGCIELAIRKLA